MNVFIEIDNSCKYELKYSNYCSNENVLAEFFEIVLGIVQIVVLDNCKYILFLFLTIYETVVT